MVILIEGLQVSQRAGIPNQTRADATTWEIPDSYIADLIRAGQILTNATEFPRCTFTLKKLSRNLL
jgi:hypothetical protein